MGQRAARGDSGQPDLTIGAALRQALDALLSILFAPACAACGHVLEHPSSGPVCGSCWRSILPIPETPCNPRGPIARAHAIGEYDGALREIVHALKYDGRRSLASPLATLMRERGGAVLDGALCVVPVPLHPSRKRSRGFNQAEDLARRIGLPVYRALERLRATETQSTLPAAERHRNVRDAFGLARAGRQLTGATVVLIDDVSTTGATLEACARVLKQAGVREVRALTAARVAARQR